MKNFFLTFLLLSLLIITALFILPKNNSKEMPPPTQREEPAEQTIPDEKTNLALKMEQALKAKYKKEAQSIKVSIITIEGNYAKGEVTTSGGGGLWFAAKRADGWILVWDGNGIIQCSVLSDYPDFPKSIVPKCFDTARDTLIDR